MVWSVIRVKSRVDVNMYVMDTQAWQYHVTNVQCTCMYAHVSIVYIIYIRHMYHGMSYVPCLNTIHHTPSPTSHTSSDTVLHMLYTAYNNENSGRNRTWLN